VVEEGDPHIDPGFGKYRRLRWAVALAKRRIGQRREDDSSLQVEGIGAQGNFRSFKSADTSVQIGEVVTTIPTIGFNVESVTYKNLNFNVWVGCPLERHTPG